MNEYIDRDDLYARHIPSRIFYSILKSTRYPNRTTFEPYGWLRTFAEYDEYAEDDIEQYAYELWHGYRGMAKVYLESHYYEYEKCYSRYASMEQDMNEPVSNMMEDITRDVSDDDVTDDITDDITDSI